jgi:hypothetical protein
MKFEISRTSWAMASNSARKLPPSNASFLEGDEYFIEISSVEELLALIDEVGEIIIDPVSIEIYDGYRE